METLDQRSGTNSGCDCVGCHYDRAVQQQEVVQQRIYAEARAARGGKDSFFERCLQLLNRGSAAR